MLIHPQMTIKELLDQYPETARVFIIKKMACAGCPAENFGTLEEAARAYHIDLQELLTNIITVVEK